MAHTFKILIDGKVKTFRKFEEIPETFENVIAFEPKIPEGPHTPEQHAEIDSWSDKFKELLKRETK